MALNGISALIRVTTMKADTANQEAMAGADKQRALQHSGQQSVHKAIFAVPISLGLTKAGTGTLNLPVKDLESQDKLDNFEIQGRMSQFNHREVSPWTAHKKP